MYVCIYPVLRDVQVVEQVAGDMGLQLNHSI